VALFPVISLSGHQDGASYFWAPRNIAARHILPLGEVQIYGVASGARMDACVPRALSCCPTLKVDD